MPDPVARPGSVASAAAPDGEPASRIGPRAAALAVSIAAGALALGVAWRYPIHPLFVIATLLAYAAALWKWPRLWLVVVPAALPALDLGPWTGWTMVEEPDLVALATLAVLVLRAPPRRADLVLRGLSGAAVALSALACVVGVAVALTRADLTMAPSAIAELSPLDPLRVAKGFVLALALLPFLRRALAERADALFLFAAGMTTGLALVAAATLAERIVFTGPFDFRVVYRVVGTFSSMHFGGGYIGGFVAMALPFLGVPSSRHRIASLAARLLVALGALYALVVTFARAAYGSAIIASLVFAAGGAASALRRGERRALVLPLVLLVAVAGVVAVAAQDARFMVRRLEHLPPDLDMRLAEWRSGMALSDPGLVTMVVGMGLGSYARTVLARRPGGRYPTDVALATENGRHFLRVHAGIALYVGQKVSVEPRQAYRFTATLRTPDHGLLVAVLCEKLLLYSVNCRNVVFVPRLPGVWQTFDGWLPSFGLGERNIHGLRRPVELSLFVPGRGTSLDIADVGLTDAAGHALLANGDFARGIDRWLPTDDNHAIWRIENQYLMTWFEEGALGIAALLLLAAASLSAAWRATAQGDAVAPALAAAVAAVLASGAFDCPLEVPRLAALFYLIAFAALAAGERAQPRAGTS